jgi:hypothetical protein
MATSQEVHGRQSVAEKNKKKRKTNPNVRHIPAFSFQTADAFRTRAMQFFDSLPAFGSAAAYAESHLGDLFASSTELTLALELYLKTVLALRVQTHEQTHDLVDLFNGLPADSRDKIATQYKERIANKPSKDVVAALAFVGGPRDKIKSPMPKRPKPLTLAALLLENRTSFEKWRYMHEVVPGVMKAHHFDFREMAILCECVRQEALRWDPKLLQMDRPARLTRPAIHGGVD